MQRLTSIAGELINDIYALKDNVTMIRYFPNSSMGFHIQMDFKNAGFDYFSGFKHYFKQEKAKKYTHY